MHMEHQPAAAQILASSAADVHAGCAAEWRVSKEQLAAAERASLYHARQMAPASNGDAAAHAA
jgi:hypothetical protein